ncbi:hypothetical protein CAPTEDRAFT_209441 [Capitella teleta]|uniref:Uncharacterized protein n=1 Tax=Capitella teleta TaxID=283909 RepID=R7UVM3_CAPTE|nr:hypothetical protein CAPTEDRAFT_209441 [Capitella teleta]|eukprot:ELU07441.1 hypothetical protein CAPTEDRAFT_209441 [Capitella teleta]
MKSVVGIFGTDYLFCISYLACYKSPRRLNVIFVVIGLLLTQLAQGCKKKAKRPNQVEAAKKRLKEYKPAVQNGCQCYKDCVKRKGCFSVDSKYGAGTCTGDCQTECHCY